MNVIYEMENMMKMQSATTTWRYLISAFYFLRREIDAIDNTFYPQIKQLYSEINEQNYMDKKIEIGFVVLEFELKMGSNPWEF